MNRRAFLQCAAAAALFGPRVCEAEPALAKLNARLPGKVVLPSDPGFAAACSLYNPAVSHPMPQAVVYCESVKDVQQALNFAGEHNMGCVVRGGRHSNAGYSTGKGLVLDLSRLNRVEWRDGTARVGAGCQVIELYDGLGAHGVTVPAGSCPTVGVSGLTLGGGFGMLSRKFGLTCDNLLEVETVTASGAVVTASETQHPDLWWASRGGGGGNFGIATSFNFKPHVVDQVAFYEARWPWQSAASVLDASQKFAPHAPDELVSGLTMYCRSFDTVRPPVATVTYQGAYLGSPEKLQSLLKPLLDPRVGTPSHFRIGAESNAGRDTTIGRSRPSQPARVTGYPQMTKAHFVERPLPTRAIDSIVAHLKTCLDNHPPIMGHLSFTAFGGAIQRIPGHASAFPHRDALFIMVYETMWGEQGGEATASASRNWVRSFYHDMHPFATGTYVNFVDADLTDWNAAYYGANLERLMAIKRRYDPANYFRFAQSIPPR